jgi:protease I
VRKYQLHSDIFRENRSPGPEANFPCGTGQLIRDAFPRLDPRTGMKALMLLANGFEDVSFFVPWMRLREEGYTVTVASPFLHPLTGEHGYTLEPTARIHELNPSDFELLVLPHGRCTEHLRLGEATITVARTCLQESRVAAIGHGCQILMSALALDGRTVTASPGIRDDVRAAGATYRDVPTVQDGNLLTCRGIDDLPSFCKQLVRFARVGTGR